MAVLDSTQFNQLVQEVREALLAGSQGVGEVEIVSSLSNIVSLPALRLVGATESVVEAPLELLSAPAVEAAADARKATDDAVVAAVNAEAAADLSEAERKDLAEIKEQAIKAGTDAAAKGDKAFSGAMNAENATLYAMQIASYLQTKLEQAQIVILSGKAMQDVIGTLDSRVKDSILICASTREAAYAAILQLRELQKQVAQAIVDAYAVFDQMQLSVADARQATQVAVKAMERICELSERTEQVIVESVIQTGDARLVTVRLETLEKDLLLSKSAADTATRLAHEQADRAKQSADESERLNMDSILLHERLDALAPVLEQASEGAVFSAAGADNAAGHAEEQSEAARLAAERANTLSDNPPKIIDGVWWKYDESVEGYVSTGLQAKGDTGSSFRVLGNYDTLEELKAAVPDGSGVDGVYGIGLEPPYTYYAWTFIDGVWDWNTQGQLQGQRGESAFEAAVRISGYAGTEEEYACNPIENAGLAEKAAGKAAVAAVLAENAGILASGSAAAADLAAENARNLGASAGQAAERAGHAAEQCDLSANEAIKAAIKAGEAAEGAVFSAAGADNAAGHAEEQSEAARLAAERARLFADNPPKIVEGYWWIFNEEKMEYANTMISAEGSGMDILPFTERDDVEIQCGSIHLSSGWNTIEFPEKFSGIPIVVCTTLVEDFIITLSSISETSFQAYLFLPGDSMNSVSGSINYIATFKE